MIRRAKRARPATTRPKTNERTSLRPSRNPPPRWMRTGRNPTARINKVIVQLKAPASMRWTETSLTEKREAGDDSQPVESREGLEFRIGANARSAWQQDPAGKLQTLTDKQAHIAKLQALLEAS